MLHILYSDTVSSQRRQYKSVRMGDARPTAMTTERIAKLSEAGFEWETSDPRHMPWEARYRELREFVQKHGTLILLSVLRVSLNVVRLQLECRNAT